MNRIFRRSGKNESEKGNALGAGFLECQLQWSQLKLSIVKVTLHCLNRKETIILNEVSGFCLPGEFTALIGASGCGKTSLLNVLARREKFIDPNVKLTGELLLNGEKLKHIPSSAYRSVSGYVMQNDALMPFLTVEETLFYAAVLTLPAKFSWKKKVGRVMTVIEMLDLSRVKHTYIGNDLVRGISGGEKKRVSIAIELIRDPAILFLDEPTSGLDSKTARDLCQTLSTIAREKHSTIVTAIHQPRAQIFQLFDRLVVMAEGGRMVFMGSPDGVISFLAEQGYPCPSLENPADHLIDMVSPDLIRHEEHVGQDGKLVRAGTMRDINRVKKLVENSQLDEPPSPPAPLDYKEVTKEGNSWFWQVFWLCNRSVVNTIRNKGFLIMRTSQTLFTAILLGVIYFQMDDDQSSINDRLGVLFFSILNISFNEIYGVLGVFPIERVVFLRERASGSYSVSAYYIGKNIAELPWQMIFSLTFATILYFMTGLNLSWYRYFIFSGTCVLIGLWASSLGFILSAGTNVIIAGALAPVINIICALFAGFFVNEDNIPSFIAWIKYLSYSYYAFSALVQNEFEGLTLTCTEDQLVSTGYYGEEEVCPITSGDQVIDNLGADELEPWQDMLVIVLMIVVLRVAAYLVLRFARPTSVL